MSVKALHLALIPLVAFCALVVSPSQAAAAKKPEIGGWGFDRFRGDAYLEVHVRHPRLVKARAAGSRTRLRVDDDTPDEGYLRIGLFRWYRHGDPPPPRGCFRARVTVKNKHGRDRDRQRICHQSMNQPA